MEVTKENPTPVPMPGETLQATLRIAIKVTKDTSTDEVKTYVTDMEMVNYDGLIKYVPQCLSEYNMRYALSLLEEHLKTSAL